MNEIWPLELERALNAWITEGQGLNRQDEGAAVILCDTIHSEHGEYLLFVKGKQQTLREEAIHAFMIPEAFPQCHAQSK